MLISKKMKGSILNFFHIKRSVSDSYTIRKINSQESANKSSEVHKKQMMGPKEPHLGHLKGLAMIFFWSGKPMYHFQKQGKIYVNQKILQQNYCKIAQIMKEKGFLASFILGGALSSVFNFLKS